MKKFLAVVASLLMMGCAGLQLGGPNYESAVDMFPDTAKANHVLQFGECETNFDSGITFCNVGEFKVTTKDGSHYWVQIIDYDGDGDLDGNGDLIAIINYNGSQLFVYWSSWLTDEIEEQLRLNMLEDGDKMNYPDKVKLPDGYKAPNEGMEVNSGGTVLG